MNWTKLVTVALFPFLIFGIGSAQNSEEEFEKKYREKYESNITKEYLNGRYIPKDVEEAIKEVDKLLAPEVKERFVALPDSIAGPKGVNTIGPWLLRNWNLYNGSRIGHFMKTKYGLSHPVDMVYFILTRYHKEQNNMPYDEEKLLSYILERRKAIFLREVKDREVDHNN